MSGLSEQLLPCPFCNGECQLPEFYGEGKGGRFVACKQCGANLYRTGPSVEENDRNVIAAWNRRPTQLAQPEQAGEWVMVQRSELAKDLDPPVNRSTSRFRVRPTRT